MNEKDLWLKLGLIVLIVGLSVTFVWPPEERLKPGIDLGGGHSLLFEIDDTGETGDRRDLAERVMEILKQRVDPGGTRNLIWRPIGRNRLEIQMPQPPKTQAGLRDAYEKARDALAATTIARPQILAALNMPADERAKATQELIGVVSSRKALWGTLVEVNDRYNELQGSTTQPVDSAVAKEMDQLFVKRNQTVDALLATNVDVRVLGDLLDLDLTSEVRQQRIDEIKKAHPDLAGLIAEMEAKYTDWSKQRGYLDDPSDLMRLLRGAGKLEFRILAQVDPATGRLSANKAEYQESVEPYLQNLQKYGPRRQEGDNYAWFEIAKPEESGITSPSYVVSEYLGKKYVLAHATEDMGLLNTGRDDWKLRRAQWGRDRSGKLAVDFELDARGGAKFAVLTGNNISKPLCIFLDDKAMSPAIIRSQINTNGQISGNFSPQEVNSLINTLEAGVLPARLKEVPLQEKSIGPGLGQTNRTKGTWAVIVSFLLTIAFMAVYYGYSGFIANIALLLNVVITLGVMSFLGNTFTLPGIAGLILTLGMAVDANVLIYERIREELQRGVSVRMAVRLGYEKAFSAILDSNVTTIITAVILGYLGSEEIKGFGQTLGIGLVTSMFTALFVTRQYFHFMLPATLDKEEVKKAWVGTAVLALFGGGLFALGWMTHRTPVLREESSLVNLGKFILVLGGSALFLMVTLYAFRFVYRVTGHQRANRLPMMKLLSAPKIDWMAKHRIFWTVSLCILAAGMVFSWAELRFDPRTILDIEFLGGTSVQVELKKEHKDVKDEQLVRMIVGKDVNDVKNSVGWLNQAAKDIEAAEVTRSGDYRYKVTLPEKYTDAQIEALLLPTFEQHVAHRGINPEPGGVELTFNPDHKETAEAAKNEQGVKQLLAQAAAHLRGAAEKMRDLRVQLVEEEMADGTVRHAFELITTETNRRLVGEAILASVGDLLQVTQPIEATLVADSVRAPEGMFPIDQAASTLSDVLGRDAAGGLGRESIARYKGGVLLVFDNLNPASTTGEIRDRLREMRLQPDFEGAAWRNFEVIGMEPDPSSTDPENPLYKKVAVAVVDPAVPYAASGQSNEAWLQQVAQREKALAQAALASTRSLQRVTQFAPQVAGEAAMKAVIAIIISLIAIAVYLWARFGSAEFGLAGIIALYHDVAVSLTALVGAHLIADTPIGRALLLENFHIDLSVIAALLTIVGFSINDTIVIFDRIRENRGRLATVSSDLINRSLNETLSRTIITSVTVFITVVVMYFFGGRGIHAFAFTMLIGVVSGTYSTIAIATPLVQNSRILWLVTIALSALTLIGLASTIETPWLETALMLAILAGALYGVVRVVGKSKPGKAQPVPAA